MDPGSSPSFARRALIIVISVTIVVLLVLLAWQAISVLVLLFAGVLVALLLNGMAGFLSERTPLSYGLSLLFVGLGVLGLLTGFGFLLGPAVAAQFAGIGESLPAAIERIEMQVRSFAQSVGFEEIPTFAEMAPSPTRVAGQVTTFFTAILGGLATVLIVFLVGIYFAVSPKIYTEGFLHLVPTQRRPRARKVLRSLGRALRKWLAARFASMLVTGVLVTLGLTLIGVPLALGLGVLSALLSFVPYLGPLIAAIPGILIGFLDSPTTALYVAILYFIMENLEGWFFTPVIEARLTHVPPGILITSQLLLGTLIGVAGIVIASPLAVAVIVLVQMLYVQDVLKDDVEVLGNEREED